MASLAGRTLSEERSSHLAEEEIKTMFGGGAAGGVCSQLVTELGKKIILFPPSSRESSPNPSSTPHSLSLKYVWRPWLFA